MQEKVNIKNSKGQNMVALICVPENPKGLSFVMHGLGGFKEQLHIKTMQDVLLNAGYLVVNFDATNSIGESDGKYEEITTQKHYEDLVDLIAWTKNQKWYKEPFVLAGHSLGGYAVTRYSEEHPVEVKAVFPYALVVSGELSYKTMEKLEPEKLKAWKETGWQKLISTSKPGTVMMLPYSHMEERLNHDLRPNADKLTMPVLFVVGENDELCLPEDNKVLYDLVPGPKEMHIVSGAPHTFRTPEHLEQLRNIFTNWLEKIK